MASPTSPFMDHAAPVLSAEPAITDEQRADLWDTFHQSKDPNELAQKLAPILVPDDLKHKLFQAKQTAMPVAPPVDKVTEAVQRVAALDPKVLDIAESHPNILKAFTTAATTPEKSAPEPAAALSAAPKGKTTPATQTPAPLSPGVTATPSGHALIHASNGGHYHVPVANLDKAKSGDPNLTVLHVEP